MLGEHRQVIFKEDMYQVIHSAHVNGERHRGYKGTFKKVSFYVFFVHILILNDQSYKLPKAKVWLFCLKLQNCLPTKVSLKYTQMVSNRFEFAIRIFFSFIFQTFYTVNFL